MLHFVHFSEDYRSFVLVLSRASISVTFPSLLSSNLFELDGYARLNLQEPNSRYGWKLAEGSRSIKERAVMKRKGASYLSSTRHGSQGLISAIRGKNTCIFRLTLDLQLPNNGLEQLGALLQINAVELQSLSDMWQISLQYGKTMQIRERSLHVFCSFLRALGPRSFMRLSSFTRQIFRNDFFSRYW